MQGGALENKTQYYLWKLSRSSLGRFITLPLRTVGAFKAFVDKRRPKPRLFAKCSRRGLSAEQILAGAVSIAKIAAIVITVGGGIAASNKVGELNYLPETVNKLEERINKKFHIPRWGNNSFVAPFWENEKASDRALADKLNIFKKKEDKISFEQARFNIALENVDELSQKLIQYENKFITLEDYNKQSQDEKLKFLSTYLGREIEIRNLVIYGTDPDISDDERKRAAAESANLQSQWYQGALSTILDETQKVLDAMPPNMGGPVKSGTAKMAAFGGTRLGARLTATIGEQLSAQIARQTETKIAKQIETKLLKEIDKKIISGVDKALAGLSPDTAFASVKGVTLAKGNYKFGLNHILARHYTQEYLKKGKTSLFPKSMSVSQIAELITDTIEHNPGVREGRDYVIKTIFKEEKYGIKELKIVISDTAYDAKGNLIAGSIKTAYPIRGSAIKIINR